MADRNEFHISGTLGADAEVKTSAKGNPYAHLRILVTFGEKGRNYIPITAFGDEAQKAEGKPEGEPVRIHGHITRSTWGQGDEKRTTTDLIADGIGFGSAESEPAPVTTADTSEEMADDDDIPF